MLFFSRKSGAVRSVLFRNLHGIVKAICQRLLVICAQGETLLQLSKTTALFRTGGTLNQLSVLGCFCTILLRSEHTGPFRWKSWRIPANVDGGMPIDMDQCIE